MTINPTACSTPLYAAGSPLAHSQDTLAEPLTYTASRQAYAQHLHARTTGRRAHYTLPGRDVKHYQHTPAGLPKLSIYELWSQDAATQQCARRQHATAYAEAAAAAHAEEARKEKEEQAERTAVALTSLRRCTGWQHGGDSAHTIAALRCIVSVTADVYGFSYERLCSGRRDPFIVEARQVAMWLCREQGYGVTEIGRALQRDHSTVIHGVGSIADHVAAHDREIVEVIDLIKRQLGERWDSIRTDMQAELSIGEEHALQAG